MRCIVPEISWHNRDPVLSVDIQCNCDPNIFKGEGNRTYRVATGGNDGHVEIWLVKELPDGSINAECVSDLKRHNRAVNAVRFSPDGTYLASGDDESALFIWKKSDRESDDSSDGLPAEMDDDEGFNRDRWLIFKTLRGHLEDVQDLAWSHDSKYLFSGSVDNVAIFWDVAKGTQIGMLNDHKGFVQGVAVDPKAHFLATLSTDRDLRIYNMNTKKIVQKVNRINLKTLPEKITSLVSQVTAEEEKENVAKEGEDGEKEEEKKVENWIKLYHGDTLKTFSRRMDFSPDGEILFTPAGFLELGNVSLNAFYAFSRVNLSRPAVVYPVGKKANALAVRCCPILFELRQKRVKPENVALETPPREKLKPPSLFGLPYRVVFAVITQDAIILYDTQSSLPFAKVANIHYTRLSDVAWSSDGRLLMVSSTDGYCSFVTFGPGELGEVYTAPLESEVKEEEAGSEAAQAMEVEEEDLNGTKAEEASDDMDTSTETTPKCTPTKKGEEEMEVEEVKKAVEGEPKVDEGDGKKEEAKVEEKVPFVIRARSAKHGTIKVVTQTKDSGIKEAVTTAVKPLEEKPEVDQVQEKVPSDEPVAGPSGLGKSPKNSDQMSPPPKKPGDGSASPKTAEKKRVKFFTLSSPKNYTKKANN